MLQPFYWKCQRYLRSSSSPLTKTFINKVDENQLINDAHIHPHVVWRPWRLSRIFGVFQEEGTNVLWDVRTLFQQVCSYRLKSRCFGCWTKMLWILFVWNLLLIWKRRHLACEGWSGHDQQFIYSICQFISDKGLWEYRSWAPSSWEELIKASPPDPLCIWDELVSGRSFWSKEPDSWNLVCGHRTDSVWRGVLWSNHSVIFVAREEENIWFSL